MIKFLLNLSFATQGRDESGDVVLATVRTNHPGNDAAQLAVLLLTATTRLVKNFGNLETIGMWRKLFCHLRQHALGFVGQNVKLPPDQDLVNATTLLFQAMSPIRFDFLDGQARILAVSHYIRQLVPCSFSLPNCVEPITKYTSRGRPSKPWSLRSTGANATFMLVVQSLDNSRTLEQLLRDLHAISRKQCKHIQDAESYHFANGILSVITERKMVRNPPPSTVADTQAITTTIFKSILKGLQFLMTNGNIKLDGIQKKVDVENLESLENFLLDKRVSYPSFFSVGSLVSVMPLKVLMLVIGAAVAEKSNCGLLEELINKKWKVHPVDKHGQIRGIDVNKFHATTVYRENDEAAPNFARDFFQVGTLSYCCIDVILLVVPHSVILSEATLARKHQPLSILGAISYNNILRTHLPALTSLQRHYFEIRERQACKHQEILT